MNCLEPKVIQATDGSLIFTGIGGGIGALTGSGSGLTTMLFDRKYHGYQY